MQLLLHQDFHYVDGCDKVTAKYRGVEVLLGNVRLMQTDTYREEETGMERSTEKEVWQGLMLTCKVGHAFPVGLAITPRGKVDGLLRYADVKTGNEAFDKRFTVKTDNAEAALALLPKKLRRKKSTRIAVICVCSVIAIALAGYLLLTAIFLDAAYHH